MSTFPEGDSTGGVGDAGTWSNSGELMRPGERYTSRLMDCCPGERGFAEGGERVPWGKAPPGGGAMVEGAADGEDRGGGVALEGDRD